MNDIVAMAMDSIRANKIRSVLTVLGVVIGVTTVIGMSSVISGLNTAISSQIEGLGSNLIFVSRFPIAVGRMDAEIRSRKKLTLEDAEAIAELVSSPERARAMGQSARQRIVSLYSWQVHCEALERVLAGFTEGAGA